MHLALPSPTQKKIMSLGENIAQHSSLTFNTIPQNWTLVLLHVLQAFE
jgi:hypothetical protein